MEREAIRIRARSCARRAQRIRVRSNSLDTTLEPLAKAMQHRALELEVEAHLLEALADIDDVVIDLCALDVGTAAFDPIEPIPA